MTQTGIPSPSTDTSPYQIRLLEEKDLPGLEWEGEFRHYRRLYAEAFRRMQRNLALLWVAEQGDRIVGQVFIQLKCDRPELCDGYSRAYLYAFRVRPECRGQGLGSRMIQVVEAELLERGYHFLTLNVARENLAARRLYRRHGFHIVAPEPGEWQYVDDKGFLVDVHEPAWRMEKELHPA